MDKEQIDAAQKVILSLWDENTRLKKERDQLFDEKNKAKIDANISAEQLRVLENELRCLQLGYWCSLDSASVHPVIRALRDRLRNGDKLKQIDNQWEADFHRLVQDHERLREAFTGAMQHKEDLWQILVMLKREMDLPKAEDGCVRTHYLLPVTAWDEACRRAQKVFPERCDWQTKPGIGVESENLQEQLRCAKSLAGYWKEAYELTKAAFEALQKAHEKCREINPAKG